MTVRAEEKDDPDRVYAVRNSEDFAAQAEAIYERLEEQAGEDVAGAWLTGLQAVKATLATLPGRLPVAEENRYFQKVHPGPPLHVVLHRHGRSIWRLLLTVHEATAEDAAYVMLHQFRHGAQKPLKKWPPQS